MSAKTGRPPASTTDDAEATKLYAGTTTSSPGRRPQARSSSTSASVPELTPTAWTAPVQAARASSNSATLAPWEYFPRSATSFTWARIAGHKPSNVAAWVKKGTERSAVSAPASVRRAGAFPIDPLSTNSRQPQTIGRTGLRRQNGRPEPGHVTICAAPATRRFDMIAPAWPTCSDRMCRGTSRRSPTFSRAFLRGNDPIVFRSFVVGLGRSGAGLHLPVLRRTAGLPNARQLLGTEPPLVFDPRGLPGGEPRGPLTGVTATRSLAEAAALAQTDRTVVHVCTPPTARVRSEEHTSELQSRPHLVCRLLLEKKKNNKNNVEHLKQK